MLDFIVLGIVPGTSFIITLRWALIMALVFWLIMLAVVEANKPRKAERPTAPLINLDSINISGLVSTLFFVPGRGNWLERQPKKD